MPGFWSESRVASTASPANFATRAKSALPLQVLPAPIAPDASRSPPPGYPFGMNFPVHFGRGGPSTRPSPCTSRRGRPATFLPL